MNTFYPNTISLSLKEAEEFETSGHTENVYNKTSGLLMGRISVEDFKARKRVIFLRNTYVPIVVCEFDVIKCSTKLSMDVGI